MGLELQIMPTDPQHPQLALSPIEHTLLDFLQHLQQVGGLLALQQLVDQLVLSVMLEGYQVYCVYQGCLGDWRWGGGRAWGVAEGQG